MPAAKKQKLTGKESKRRKHREERDLGPEEGDGFFLDPEDDSPQPDETEDEPSETAEAKRLRLAKAYLKQLRASGAADDEEGRELVLDDDELAEKLRQQAQEAGGYLQRQIAGRIRIPTGTTSQGGLASQLYRLQDPAVTAIALTNDDATVYSVGKSGRIFKLDVASGTKAMVHSPEKGRPEPAASGPPDWVRKGPRKSGAQALLAVAVSSDGRFMAVGGAERKVHVWDTRTMACVQSYPGHKDAITGLAFRHETHELFSASLDRSVKIWSLDDSMYVDTLFGHQAEVLAIDALRQQRVVSVGHDHTCRVWKVPEESQLVYRAPGMAIDCCRYVTGTEWVTGSTDGSLALWSQLKKKPAFVVRNAHACSAGQADAGAGWVQSVAVCRGSDLLASGSGDGHVRLWQFQRGQGSNRSLHQLGSFPVKGFVNALALANSGRFVVAGLGREQRLGRWASFQGSQSGLVVQQLDLAAAGGNS